MKNILTLIINLIVVTSMSSAQSTKNLYYYENTMFIPDGDGNSIELTMFVEDYTPGQTIWSSDDICSICVTIEHSNLDDLEIIITCPNAQDMTLVNYNSGESFLGEPILEGYDPGIGYRYCWTPSSENGTLNDASTSHTTIPANNYSPDQTFNNLIGCVFYWDWHLKITDNNSSENGYLFSWSIEFCEQTTELSDTNHFHNPNNTNVYPNPCSETIYFDLDINNYTIELFNIYGQKIKVIKSDNSKKTSISTIDLNDGMYFYTITSSDTEKKSVGKLIIKK